MNNNDSADNSPNPNPSRSGMSFNENSGGSNGNNFPGNQMMMNPQMMQMMNPQMMMMMNHPGMMGGMGSGMNQDMMMGGMGMMGGFCGPAGNGNGNGNGMGSMGGGEGMMGPQAQGMTMAQMQNMMQMQMMRKRQMEAMGGDEQPSPSAKRPNLGSASSDIKADLQALEKDKSLKKDDKSDDEDAKDKDDAKDDASDGGGADSPSPREHKTVPPSKEGIKYYSRNDVLCGRGGGTNVHPGNRRFRDLINANRRAYLKARKNDKPAISRSIVRTIREMNGRFLKKDEKKGLWFEIGDDGAREKTSQALRQRAPEMRKILFEDEQRHQQQQQQEMMMRTMGGNFGPMGGMAGMGGMGSMGGMGGMGSMGGGNGDVPPALLAKYNMLHQKNFMAQEKNNMLHQKNMILQRLAMSGLAPQGGMGGQGQGGSSFENMSQQALLQGGMKPVTPRGA